MVTLTGTSSEDTLIGGSGNDSISGLEEEDSLVGLGGNDTIDGGDNSDIIFGGDGNDLITDDNGFDTISGGSGNDTISSGGGRDSISGGSGNDSIDGGGGQDLIRGDGFSPLEISGAVLWLDATDEINFTFNGGNIETWSDLSPAGNNITQTTAGLQPLFVESAINSQSAVRFDGVDDFLNTSTIISGSGGRTFFVVTRPDAVSSANNAVFQLNDTASPGNGEGYFLSLEQVGGSSGTAIRVK